MGRTSRVEAVPVFRAALAKSGRADYHKKEGGQRKE
jgi:hypothetical protein